MTEEQNTNILNNSLTEEEKMAMANGVGNLIMESATLRFMTESDEETAERFSKLVETYADKDNLLEILAEAFPSFGVILEEEAEAFRKDAEAILTPESGNKETS